MEAKFKKGDKFIPRMTKTNAAEWNRYMKLYDGETLIVEQITPDGYIRPKDFGLCIFHPDWCEKVEDSAHLISKATKPKKEIDWEQRRYELAKEFTAAIISNLSLIMNSKKDNDWAVRFGIDSADEMIKQLKEQ